MTMKKKYNESSIKLLPILLVLLTLQGITPNSSFATETKIMNIRHWSGPDHTRVVIDASKDIDYTITKTTTKLRIKLRNASIEKKLSRRYIIGKAGVQRILLSTVSPKLVLMDIYLSGKNETKVFSLPRTKEKPPRLVIDVLVPEKTIVESNKRKKIRAEWKRTIIVIDPGHGGDDPGAVGPNETQEKKVALNVAKKLQYLLNREPGFRAFLTRDGDYYLSLRRRIKVAQDYGADAFISLHTDAEENGTAHGASVYTLSLGGASSEAAKILAQKENFSDITGDSGIDTEAGAIILNMKQTNNINRSRQMGNLILKHLSTVNSLKYSSVQEAPFTVLKLPEIPSVLVELGYISHPQEEKKLKKSQVQREMALTIKKAILEYFHQNERSATGDGKTSEVSKVGSVHSGKRTKVSPIDNHHSEKRFLFHIVKKGETLEKIARKYKTTVTTIRKNNPDKQLDPLYVDEKLRIPKT
ncbi:MAG: N-acetylmuramoyl-L-alanine amidase [Syntrophales bacterium]|nr:N-acetylmuramoyl-L-alanine amidase [Syntrophales bacterium]